MEKRLVQRRVDRDDLAVSYAEGVGFFFWQTSHLQIEEHRRVGILRG